MSARGSAGFRIGVLVGSATAALLALASCASEEQHAAPADGARDGAVELDGGNADGAGFGRPEDSGLSLDGCLPVAVTELEPVGVNALVEPACSDAQIHAITEACIKQPPSPSCATVVGDPANRLCGQCLVSSYGVRPITAGQPVPPARSTWGPVVAVVDSTQGAVILPNLGACVALADPSLAACGQLLNTALQCTVAACAGTCTIPKETDPPAEIAAKLAALSNCMRVAAVGGCAELSNSCVAQIDAGKASFCLGVGNFVDTGAFERMARLQCGISGDAGGP